MSLRSTCLSNVFAVSAIGSPVNSFDLQAPHIASDAGRSGATRLTAEQWGQTAWSGSVMGRLSAALNVAAIADAFKRRMLVGSQKVPSITNW